MVPILDLGDLRAGDTVDFFFTTDINGVLTQLAGGALRCYKANNLTQTTLGFTLTVDFDGIVGLNHARLVMSDGFYVNASDYLIAIDTGTVGGVSLIGMPIARLSLANRLGVRTVLGLASANLDTQLAAIQADTDNLQTRVPATLQGGRMDSFVGAMAADVVTAASIANGAIDAATFAAGAIDAAAIAADAIGSSELAASAVTEIQTGLALAVDLATVASYIDTEIGAIKAKTDNLPASPAAVSDIAAALTATIADSIPADGTRPSIAQGIYMINQYLLERGVSGSTMTVYKADGTTPLFTISLNNPTTPTLISRAT